MSSSIGIVANSIILAAWFTSMGSQTAAGTTSSAKKLVCGQRLQACDQQDLVQARPRPVI
jgi:hypothetical protein